MKDKKHKPEETPPAPGGDAPAPEAPATAAEAGAAPSEQDALKDRLLRLQADFDNFRKRTTRERAELSQRALEDLVVELLPVLDHFELGLKMAIEHHADQAVHDGFQLVYDQLSGVLKKCGVVPVDAHSSSFDPREHEAVAHVASNEYPADAIIEQSRRGYRLGEKLIRPVQVVVSSGPGAPRGDGMEQMPGGEPSPEA